MTTFAISGRPPWAVTIWADDNRIYVELPVTNGPPYITAHSFSEGGLGKALATLRDLHRKHNPSGSAYTIAPHPKLSKTVAGTTENQRENARAVLKRLKII